MTAQELQQNVEKALDEIRPFLENDGVHTPDRKVSIDKIRNDLKWEPRYNSFVKGYESILG